MASLNGLIPPAQARITLAKRPIRDQLHVVVVMASLLITALVN
jgi:hypothetical protein